VCGQVYHAVALAPGERAICPRCGTVLATRSRWGADAPLAFAATGLALAIPAACLPIVTAGRLGHPQTFFLFTGVAGLWTNGMQLLAVLVCLCGGLIPLLLLATLVHLIRRERRPSTGAPSRFASAAPALARWAMPEVQVLAVLVAIVKLGSLIRIRIGPGFWCYVAMSIALLIAFRTFDLEFSARRPARHEPL
jgi:paraquat-inducible protein A